MVLGDQAIQIGAKTVISLAHREDRQQGGFQALNRFSLCPCKVCETPSSPDRIAKLAFGNSEIVCSSVRNL